MQKKKLKLLKPLKHLYNFWRTLDIPLINCELNLTLIWSEDCVIKRKATRDVDHVADPAVAAVNKPTDATIEIKNSNCMFQNHFIN